MNSEELQVLGKGAEQDKRKVRIITFASMVILTLLVILGFWSYKHATHKDNRYGETCIIQELQAVVDSLLDDELQAIDGMQGQVIVMEVQTGRILAMAGRERRFDGKFQPCQNFAFQQEPGSMMFAASLLASIETGELALSDSVDSYGGIWDVDGSHLMKDHNWYLGGYGRITLEEALRFSSTIGVGKTVSHVFKGKELSYYDLLDKMCLGKPDSIKGIEGLKPMSFICPNDSLSANYRMLTNSIGYELSLAPIQTLTFFNAIANGGKMVKPMLYADTVEVINPQIASRESIVQLQIALERTVSQGLGSKAGTKQVCVAGSVGNAQLNVSYDDDSVPIEYHISFCGYFPADNPRYSMIVSMNKQGIPASGGGMAGPVFHNVVEWMVNNHYTE